jgi:SOS-response transcriptional repressor LexA
MGDKNLRGDHVKALLKARGRSITDLAGHYGTSRDQVSRWLSGKYSPPWDFPLSVAEYLDVPLSDIIDGWYLTDERAEYLAAKEIPVLSGVSAGGTDAPIFLDGDTPVGVGMLGSVPIPVNDPNAFALEIRGDSMEPGYPNGSRVIVSPTVGFKNKAVHFVQDTNGRSFIKKVAMLSPDRYLLQPLNPSYDPIELKASEIRHIWRVVMILP